MRVLWLVMWTTGAFVLLVLLFGSPDANADPVPIPVPVPVPGGGLGVQLPVQLPAGGAGGTGAGIGGNGTGPGGGGIFDNGFGISNPGAPAIFLCPGVGAAGGAIGAGGGYCDFGFTEVKLPGPPGFGVLHTHCEWGGFTPITTMWQCWRVFPGQPDHPRLNDPDIIPDGFGVPWAITGPAPNDQWPPAGLAPAPPPEPPPPGEPPPEPPP